MDKGKDLILVTGATGQQGGAVCRELLSAGHRVRAMTRNPAGEAARALLAAGAEVIRGDLDDAASLERAVDGAWGVYALQNTWEAGVEREEEQGKRLAEVARRKGVHHYVQASVQSVDRSTGIPHFDNKWRIEERVRELGFPSCAFVRPVFFMENWLSPWFKPGIDQGTLAIALRPETRLQMVAVEDIGRCGLIAFEAHDRYNGQPLDLAGDALTMPEVAEVLSQVTGRRITFQRLPIEQVRQGSEDFAIMLEWFDSTGYDVDIAALPGRYGFTPLTFRDWAARQDWG